MSIISLRGTGNDCPAGLDLGYSLCILLPPHIAPYVFSSDNNAIQSHSASLLKLRASSQATRSPESGRGTGMLFSVG